MSSKNTLPATAIPAGIDPSQPIRVVYERPKPRIAQGILALLLAGPIGLIIFAMGQTLWGALWRGWFFTIAVILVVMHFAL